MMGRGVPAGAYSAFHSSSSKPGKPASRRSARQGARTGPRVVTEDTKNAMRQCLKDIQTGEYAKSFILENKAGAPTLISRRRLNAEHQIEVVGEKLRAMMPWIAKNKMVDQSKN